MLSSIRKVSRFPSFKLLNQNTIKSRNLMFPRWCTTMTSKEITIPVPYGSLAVKAWGNPSGYPVLALHGYKDNCGTFDRLAPLLHPSLYIVALDSPGHGLSSPLPSGTIYSKIDFLRAIRHVTDHLQWKRFSFLGHSMGGLISQTYATFYPEIVEKVISLDVIAPFMIKPINLPELIASSVDDVKEAEVKFSKPPYVYTNEMARKRLIDGLFCDVTKDSADILLRRGTKPSWCGTGVVFTSDPKIKVKTIFLYDIDTEFALISRLKCDMLIITAKNAHPSYPINKHYPHIVDSFIQQLRKYCKSFAIEKVEGTHFVHINNPERLVPLVNKFLLSRSL